MNMVNMKVTTAVDTEPRFFSRGAANELIDRFLQTRVRGQQRSKQPET
jgi:hypothetical protein